MNQNVKLPEVGSAYTVSRLEGYKAVQNRPSCCSGWRPSILERGKYTGNCEGACGGNCNGKTVHYPGIVTGIIYWADNSIDIEVLCEDGITRRDMTVAPHGDACF